MRLNLAALLCLASTLSGVDAAFRTNAHDDFQFGLMQKRSVGVHAAEHGHIHKRKSESSHKSPKPSHLHCKRPPNGWTLDDKPDVKCGNEILLQFCQDTDEPDYKTYTACWADDPDPKLKDAMCAGCHLTPQKDDNNPMIPCLNSTQVDLICNQKCPGTCPPSTGPSPPSGSPKHSPGGKPSPPTLSPAEAPGGSPSPASPSSGGSSSPSGKSSHSEKKQPSPKLDCNKPPNGWNRNKEPAVECGNDVLLDWCQEAYDPAEGDGYTTISACWLVDGDPKDTAAYCAGCPAKPKGGENNPPVSCLNKTQQDAICKKCPTTCPPPDKRPKPDCNKPKTGWKPGQLPDHRCGNEVLLDYCHHAWDKDGSVSYAACYLPYADGSDNYNGFCLGCGPTPQAGQNAPYAPCFNKTQVDLVCNDKCPGTCTVPS